MILRCGSGDRYTYLYHVSNGGKFIAIKMLIFITFYQ